MSTEETKLAQQILDAEFKNAYPAVRRKDGQLDPITGLTQKGFRVPGFHFQFSKTRIADFQIVVA